MWVGKTFAWCILILTLIVCYDVIARKIFSAPLPWGFDAQLILYGTLFMMGGAYTLSRNSHVRGDMIYRNLSVRRQATIDLALYLIFFLPGITALVYGGYNYAALSWAQQEKSVYSSQVPIFLFKTVIPVAGFFLLVQGIAEIIRCIQALQRGVWPERLSDVEETETRLAKESQL
jgi:TRAP-type mannitol/chloroaromatic compound transport system permease small subunit